MTHPSKLCAYVSTVYQDPRYGIQARQQQQQEEEEEAMDDRWNTRFHSAGDRAPDTLFGISKMFTLLLGWATRHEPRACQQRAR